LGEDVHYQRNTGGEKREERREKREKKKREMRPNSEKESILVVRRNFNNINSF
jgi:hypothetical protein